MKTTKAFRLQEVRQSHTDRVYGRDNRVEHMNGAAHEEEAGNLAASGVNAVMDRYWDACSVVVALRGHGAPIAQIAWRAGLGHGYIYGMLRDAEGKIGFDKSGDR